MTTTTLGKFKHLRWSRRFLRHCGLPEREDVLRHAGEYQRWRLQAAFWGPIAVLCLIAWDAIVGADYSLAARYVVYPLSTVLLINLGAANLPMPHRDGAMRTASLAPRRVLDLLPRWAAAVPCLVLLSCLLAPLRGLIWEVGYPSGRGWYVSGLALAGLVAYFLALRKLLLRRWPADDGAAAHLDMVTRALTARRNAAYATSLGCVLLAALNAASADHWGLHAFTPGGWAVLALALALAPVSELKQVPRRLRSGPADQRIVSTGARS